MNIFQVDDSGLLFISPAITDWESVASRGIDVVIDLEGGLDDCIPTAPASCLYVYFPIYDEELPDLARLEAVSLLGAHLVQSGHRVLSHCGIASHEANGETRRAGGCATAICRVERLRARRPGALFNEVFASYVSALTVS